MEQPVWNFEQEPGTERRDETDVNLRAYFDRMQDDKMLQYSPSWSIEQVIEWDGNFRDDGNLMLLCSERDVDVEEYRRVIEDCIRYRNRVRPTLCRPLVYRPRSCSSLFRLPGTACSTRIRDCSRCRLYHLQGPSALWQSVHAAVPVLGDA